MFDGYLEVGGVEVVNNERTRGYARTITCPFNFKDVPCDTLEEALAALAAEAAEPSPGPYTYDSIVESPWYDRTAPSESSRFLGVFAVSMKGFYSSTRSATVTETIGDGGNVGLQRRATREVRVKAVLLAKGRDALEYGTRWLDAALDPAACGRHAESCGTTDMLYLTDCPPARSEVTSLTAQWGEPVTNLATNPSFEATTAATVEVRRNFDLNPRMISSNTGWVTANGGALTATATGAQVDFATGVSAGGSRAIFYQTNPIAAVPGETWNGSYEVTVPAGFPAVTVYAGLVSYGGASDAKNGASVTINPGETKRVSTGIQTNVPTATTGIRSVMYADAALGIPVGARIVVAKSITEKSPVTGSYFDGTTLPAGDFTYAWLGAANASASTQNALSVPGVATTTGQKGYSSTDQPLTGSRVMRNRLLSTAAIGIPVMNTNLTTGTVYTLVGRVRPVTRDQMFTPRIEAAQGTPFLAPMGVWTEFRVTVPNGSGSIAQTGLLINAGSGHQVGDLIDVDAVTIVLGEYTGPSFDGSTPDILFDENTPERTVLADYGWTGAADASTSTWTPGIVVAIEDPVLYLDTLESHLRYLHGVGTVSGPNEGAEQDLGNDFWMLEVEFVLVAGRPFVYSITKPVVLPVTPDTVVDDVPKNLIPYPSAVLPAAAPVVVARNFSTNPSVETNATGWTATKTVISGADPGAGFTSGRVNELAANRAWSFKGQIVGPAASSGKTRITLTQTVTPTLTPTTRVSVNIWGAVLRLAGTDPGTTLDKLSASAQWQDAASAAVGPVIDLGTATVDQYGGHPFNKSGLKAPAGATKIKVQIDAEVTWTTGSDVRVYADALAVSVP